MNGESGPTFNRPEFTVKGIEKKEVYGYSTLNKFKVKEIEKRKINVQPSTVTIARGN